MRTHYYSQGYDELLKVIEQTLEAMLIHTRHLLKFYESSPYHVYDSDFVLNYYQYLEEGKLIQDVLNQIHPNIHENKITLYESYEPFLEIFPKIYRYSIKTYQWIQKIKKNVLDESSFNEKKQIDQFRNNWHKDLVHFREAFITIFERIVGVEELNDFHILPKEKKIAIYKTLNQTNIPCYDLVRKIYNQIQIILRLEDPLDPVLLSQIELESKYLDLKPVLPQVEFVRRSWMKKDEEEL